MLSSPTLSAKETSPSAAEKQRSAPPQLLAEISKPVGRPLFGSFCFFKSGFQVLLKKLDDSTPLLLGEVDKFALMRIRAAKDFQVLFFCDLWG